MQCPVTRVRERSPAGLTQRPLSAILAGLRPCPEAIAPAAPGRPWARRGDRRWADPRGRPPGRPHLSMPWSLDHAVGRRRSGSGSACGTWTARSAFFAGRRSRRVARGHRLAGVRGQRRTSEAAKCRRIDRDRELARFVVGHAADARSRIQRGQRCGDASKVVVGAARNDVDVEGLAVR